MVKVTYPNGKVLHFAKVVRDKGFIYKKGGKVYIYRIPEGAIIEDQ